MAATPRWKVYRGGEYVAACKCIEDAAVLIADAVFSHREAMAAVRAFLADGAEILRRCRVEKEWQYLTETLVEFALLSMVSHHDYSGDGYEVDELRRQIEAVLRECVP